MSKYSQLRPEYFHSLALGQPSERVQQHVPQTIVDRWTARYYRVERPTLIPERPRLMNHFKMGADPEFAFLHMATAKQLSATEYGLKAGLCFGADNNGRLVELRPRASHYLVEVLASLLSELRWLAALRPNTLSTAWKAGAYSGQDGLGGHVHFGRKRKHILEIEVKALDKINALLHNAGVFSEDELKMRLQKKYGGPSDWRPQVHGYEFRSFPSWMNTPWIAYLTMVLSKIAVLNPAEVGALQPQKGMPANARKSIRNLLAYYKNLDDDALLAFCALDVWGLPSFGDQPTDFKTAWGIYPLLATDFKPVDLLPLAIEPSRSDIEDVFFYLLQGRPIYSARPSDAQWDFKFIPKGYVAAQKFIDTHLCPGLMELLWDVLWVKEQGMLFHFDTEGNDPLHHSKTPGVYASSELAQKLGAQLQTLPYYKGVRQDLGGTYQLSLNKWALDAKHLPVTKRWLLSGIFPVARYDALDKINLENWKKAAPITSAKKSVCLFDGGA